MLVSNLFRWLVPIFTVLMACSASQNDIQQSEAGDHIFKRNAERQRGRRNRGWSNFRRLNNQSEWRAFTPPTPDPDEVDCHIEVEVRHRVAGRCVRLGGQLQTAACQSGMHMNVFNNDCESILTRREAREAPNPEQGGQPGHTEH